MQHSDKKTNRNANWSYFKSTILLRTKFQRMIDKRCSCAITALPSISHLRRGYTQHGPFTLPASVRVNATKDPVPGGLHIYIHDIRVWHNTYASSNPHITISHCSHCSGRIRRANCEHSVRNGRKALKPAQKPRGSKALNSNSELCDNSTYKPFWKLCENHVRELRTFFTLSQSHVSNVHFFCETLSLP